VHPNNLLLSGDNHGRLHCQSILVDVGFSPKRERASARYIWGQIWAALSASNELPHRAQEPCVTPQIVAPESILQTCGPLALIAAAQRQASMMRAISVFTTEGGYRKQKRRVPFGTMAIFRAQIVCAIECQLS